MRKASVISAGLACLIALAAGGDALAKSRNRQPGYSVSQSRGPIEVERRSFLDPGTKVPTGSTNRYMVQQTFNNQDPIEANQRSWYMQETLPRKYEVPYDDGFTLDLFP
ncbi:hypothetical protein LG047_14415 [Methylocystis sp. WRRC1]|uniref:hypothetical protein n=1 Tax=unclassified Methylocystis TaxID=2625913 RepID=UPI0001F8864D|nr:MULTISPECIES: hypothetical protein [unclassified Methylocystis]MCC3246494.1 hypothetical protein [Methylocystis sp. WRRC1]